MIKGSCLCGAVRYEIRGEIGRIVNCHCSMCRKAHGAGFGSWSQVKSADFAIAGGEADIASYQSSPQVRRTFCRKCGSSLQYIDLPKPERFFLAVGTLDDDPGVRPAMHIFTGSKAPWLDIADRLPQHEDWP
jgi:hypothetical protein